MVKVSFEKIVCRLKYDYNFLTVFFWKTVRIIEKQYNWTF